MEVNNGLTIGRGLNPPWSPAWKAFWEAALDSFFRCDRYPLLSLVSPARATQREKVPAGGAAGHGSCTGSVPSGADFGSAACGCTAAAARAAGFFGALAVCGWGLRADLSFFSGGMAAIQVQLPPKLLWVFDGDAMYRGAYGGRGSAKTRSFAKMAAIWGWRCARQGERGVIVCGREYMNNLDESSTRNVGGATEHVI